MSKTLDDWSLRASPLQTRYKGENTGSATGFFWTEAGRLYLITNWHVLSGRDPANRQPLDQIHGVLPDEIIYQRFIEDESFAETVEHMVALEQADGTFLWFEHPVYGSAVDVAAIEIPVGKQYETEKGIKSTYVNPIQGTYSESQLKDFENGNQWHSLRQEMGADLFVLGFPLGLKPTGHFPIWKRASVATEMDVLLEGKPAFLIDTATRKGMSGSPVISQSLTVIPRLGLTAVDRHLKFLGIYSGRHVGEKVEEAQLGIVWRQELIREIVAARQQYKWP